MCAQVEFIDAKMTGANFQEASIATTGDKSFLRFSGAKLNDANFKEAVVKSEGEDAGVRRSPPRTPVHRLPLHTSCRLCGRSASTRK